MVELADIDLKIRQCRQELKEVNQRHKINIDKIREANKCYGK